MIRLRTAAFAAAVLAVSASGTAYASVTFTATAGSRDAAASFSVDGAGNLVVRLTNTATSDVMVPTDILTAVYFNISGPSLSLSRASAVLAPGSSVFYDPQGQPAGGVVGGEWAYRNDINIVAAGVSVQYGISSTGVGIFGPGDLFPGVDLEPPSSPDGPQYGLLSAGDDTGTGNGGVTGSGGLIKNSVIFTLGGAGANFDLSRISGIVFQYGTNLSEPQIPSGNIPAPASGLVVIAGMAALRRRR